MQDKKWFVLYTKPKHELKVKENLSSIDIESFCPTVVSDRIWSDRIKKVREVIIKSIVFVKCSDNERNNVFDIPSTVRYLFYCSKPAVVLKNEIEHLKKLEENNYIVKKHLSIGNIIFLDKINQEGVVEKKTNAKTWINLKNINVRICI
jgi:transcription antitermination factor NusG